VPARLGGVEHIGGIGKDHSLHPHLEQDPLDLAHVRGFHESGNHVDLVLCTAVSLGEELGHGPRHVSEARDMGAHVARRVRVDDMLSLWNDALVPGGLHDARDVVSDGFGKTRRMNSDHIGIVDMEDVLQGLPQVRGASEDRCPLGE